LVYSTAVATVLRFRCLRGRIFGTIRTAWSFCRLRWRGACRDGPERG
jgi:hypothetical protein